MKTALVILTRNEIGGLEGIFHKIPLNAVDEYFAVDGKSTDGTVEFFKGNGVPVIVQEKLGRGEAFRIARRRAAHDGLIFFSPDGNEDPHDIPNFKLYMEQGYDMVIASRLMKGGKNEEDSRILPLRKWANQAFTRLANVVWNRGNRYVTDTINGYRAISKEAFDRLQPDAEGYAIEFQMSIRAMKIGLKIKEFPTGEGQRIGSVSKLLAIPTGLKFLRLMAREIWLGREFQGKPGTGR
jgi:hypothetical protein